MGYSDPAGLVIWPESNPSSVRHAVRMDSELSETQF
jgi:hypothetical protein